jgi:3-keto-L-gulonate-6-phosphate decarboxylase
LKSFLGKIFREKNSKKYFPTEKILKTIFTFVGIGAAGGVRVNVVRDALKAGADILVVGRAITASKDIKRAADEFIERMDKEEIDLCGIMTTF